MNNLFSLYIYQKCSTCKQAMDYLKQKEILFKTIEITETPPSVKELQQMLHYKVGDVKKLFNTSGLQYRELELSKKLPAMSLDEALLLLSKHGMLVKRPFLLGANIGLNGFRKNEWEAVFNKKEET